MSNLFEELKRRNVVRVGIAYVVIGWLIIEVIDTIAPRLGMPDWVPTFFIVLVLVGLPLALFLSWVYELRPETGADGEMPAKSGGPLNYVMIGALAVALGFFIWERQGGEPVPAETTETAEVTPEVKEAKISIAVLPFADLSPAGDQEYFSDGISEELLNVLARVEGLRVASRTSSFAFKNENKNLAEIAGVLGVTHVLEGSLRRAGERVRITVQLIDAKTDTHLWSETYDRELDDIFAIQDEIADAIVTELSETLGIIIEKTKTVTATTANMDAYELYLEAQQLAAIDSTENVRRRVELLERAVELDPEFAEAWGRLARALDLLPLWDHGLDMVAYQRRAIIAAERGLELDPSNSWALFSLHAAYFYLHEWERSDEALQQARSRIPGFIGGPQFLLGLGYLARANEDVKILKKLDPESGFYNLLDGLYLESIGQDEAAIAQFELAILGGFYGGAEGSMAEAYWDLGQTSVWTALMATDLLARDPELLPLVPHMRDLLLATGGDRPQAVRRFRAIVRELGFEIEDLVRPGPRYDLRVPNEIAVALGAAEKVADSYWNNTPMFWMWSQGLNEFRQTEAFRGRVRASGMLAYWQKHGWPDLCRAVGNEDFECE